MQELSFTKWVSWDKRNQIVGCEFPGVYAIAITVNDLSGSSFDYSYAQYIGMSNSLNGLKGRWSQLHQGIRGIRGRHSGGDTIFKELGHFEIWKKKLFVAACPVECSPFEATPNDLRLMGIVAYLEYEAFASFSENVADMNKPKYNKK